MKQSSILVSQNILITHQIGNPDNSLFHTLVTEDKGFLRFHKKYHPIFLIQYEWNQKIDYEFRDPTTPALDFNSSEIITRMLRDVQTTPWLKTWQPFIKDLVPKKVISSLKTMIAKKRRQPSKNLRDIVVCPDCKLEVKWEDKFIYCNHCDADYPILGDIPRLTPKPKKDQPNA